MNETVSLAVTQTDSKINQYLHELNWYHNGLSVDITDSRYTLSNNNMTLTIAEVSEEDAGIYSVQFDGLLIYPYNKLCEQKSLELLRRYPVLAPAVISLNMEGIYTIFVLTFIFIHYRYCLSKLAATLLTCRFTTHSI